VHPVVSVTYSKWSFYAGYAAELLLPEEFRLGGIIAQQVPKVTLGSLATQRQKECDNLPNSNDVDFGPGMSERDRCFHLR